MKKFLFLPLFFAVSCGNSEAFTAIEQATSTARAALDTATLPSSVASIAARWNIACNDAVAQYGSLQGAQAQKFERLGADLQRKINATSDSLSEFFIRNMTLIEQ